MKSEVKVDIVEREKITSEAQFYFVQYLTLRDELRLSDDQVISAVGMSKPIVLTLIQYWEGHPDSVGPLWRDVLVRQAMGSTK